MARTEEAWNFGFLAVSSKSLFISFFDYVARRDELSMGIKVLEHKERGFNPSILTSDLLFTYRELPATLAVVYTGFRTNHARHIISRIIRDLPLKAEKDKFFCNYMVRIKKRFNSLYEYKSAGEINSSIGQRKRELKLFYTEDKRKWAQPMLTLLPHLNIKIEPF